MSMTASLSSLIIALVVLVSAPAGAVTTAPSTEPVGKSDRADRKDLSRTQRQAARLDQLFSRLATATDARRARRIAGSIRRRMNQSGSNTIDILMRRANARMQSKKYGQALDLLDGVIRLRPAFAEGWNRRATVHFMLGNYGQSIADIEQVLVREPRHWGAIAGLSMILTAIDRKQEAVVMMEKALEVHPHQPKLKERRDKLKRELSGADI